MSDHQRTSLAIFSQILLGAFGLFLLGVGLYALFFSNAEAGWLKYPFSLVLIVLGNNALYAAKRNTRAWLSRIGPCPDRVS
ncbi:MAG: hypothetical protein ACK5JI_05210 [Azonexus sp.]